MVYPQFATVPVEAFERYEARHQRLVSFAVVPQHRLLCAGFDPQVHQRLLKIDTARLVAAAGAVVAAVWYAT